MTAQKEKQSRLIGADAHVVLALKNIKRECYITARDHIVMARSIFARLNFMQHVAACDALLAELAA